MSPERKSPESPLWPIFAAEGEEAIATIIYIEPDVYESEAAARAGVEWRER